MKVMRIIMKTATYAAMHLVVAVSVAYALSGDWRIALSIGLLEPAIQTVFYNVHERLWGAGDQDPLPGPEQAVPAAA
jgi:uncharacterized membrane protein